MSEQMGDGWWVDGNTDGWIEGWMDEQTSDGCLDGWKDWWVDGQMDEHMCGQMYRMCSWVKRTKDVLDRCVGGWMDG